jgi:non-specific serine/threonine protein kinase
MTPERWREVERLFHAACERAPEQRAAFVAASCCGDEGLRREVEELLQAAARTDSFIDRSAVEAAGAWGGEATAGVLRAGQRVGPYEVVARLGAGGMGEVYLARDTRLGRKVALKLLAGALAGQGQALRRFAREARAASALSHPNIVVVHDVGEVEGQPYLVTEYVEGETLRRRLGRGPLAALEAVRIAAQVAGALAAAHATGVVHRDVKPENVMVRADGLVKVLDFGIAKLVEGMLDSEAGSGDQVPTDPGVAMGTPYYMSPEQASGPEVDGRTDVWSLGVVLYEMVAGRRPFEGATPERVLRAILHRQPARLSRVAPGVGPELERVVGRTLAKRVEARYGRMQEMLEDLRRLERQFGAAARDDERAPESGGPGQVTQEGVSGTGEPMLTTTAAKEQPTGSGGTATNLPQPLTSFVGREKDLAWVREALTRSRLVTLTGVGGIGKTRVALEAAREALADFPDGVWLVELAALTDPALVPSAVAQALGVREQAGRGLAESLAEWCASRRVLLVLDNCEHLVEACAQLAEALLRARARLRVLATSREALRLEAETVWVVQGLTVPEAGGEAPAEELARYEATRLFVERARLSRPGYAVTDRSAAAIAVVCRRLEGIPLALELAAARVGVLSPEQILSRLEARFRLLVGGSRTAPARQRTLRATIDWSYDLLSQTERGLLRRLAVFAGGWTLEAAEGVCTSAGIEQSAVLALLAQLVDKSLVHAEEQGHEARYGMLETVWEYALERLEARGEAEAARQAHARYFLELAVEAEPQLFVGARAAAWLARLEAELDNLRAALGWLLEQDADACLRLAVAVRQLWLVHGHYTEGRRWLEAALARSRATPALVRAKAHSGVGEMAQRQGDLAAARGYAEEQLHLGREMGDALHIGWASYSLGTVAVLQGDLQAAHAYLEESLARGREAWDDRLIGNATNSLGELAREEGAWAEARALYEQALALLKQAGSQMGVSVALTNLGAVAWEAGDLEGASTAYRDALGIEQALGNRVGIGYCLEGFGAVAAARGPWARAARLGGAAEALREEVGAPLERLDQRLHDGWVSKLRAALDPATLEKEWARGRAMGLEEAVREALVSVQGT